MRRIELQYWLHRVTLIASVVAVTGCATWSDRTTTTKSKSPLTSLSNDARAASIEVEFVPIVLSESPQPASSTSASTTSDTSTSDTSTSPEASTQSDSAHWATLAATESTEPATASDRMQSLWQWVDETGIDPELRRRLSENGLRIGRVVEQERFQNRLQSLRTVPDEVESFLTKAAVATESSQGQQKIQMRIGRRYELPVRQPTRGNEVALVRLNGETIGQTVTDPQYLFAMTATNGRSSGVLQLQLRPEIQHGAMKQTWVGVDTALRIDQRRSVWSLQELEIDLQGGQGDVFLISTLGTSGLGRQMFSGTMPDGAIQHTLMLVKFAHVPTSIDHL